MVRTRVKGQEERGRERAQVKGQGERRQGAVEVENERSFFLPLWGVIYHIHVWTYIYIRTENRFMSRVHEPGPTLGQISS